MASSSKKSTTIVNQYQYTDPLMAEVQDGYAAQTYKNYITLIIIALICAFFTWREYNTHKGVLCILFAIIVVLCVIATIVSLVSTNKRKKAEIQAFRDSYSKDGYDLMITIEGTRIRSYKNNAPDVDLRKNDVRGVFETERFFVFQLTGGILLPLKKDAFIKGDVEACRNYITELKKK